MKYIQEIYNIFSTSGRLFMMVFTLASLRSTSLYLRGEVLDTGVLDTAFRELLPGVQGIVSVILIIIFETEKLTG